MTTTNLQFYINNLLHWNRIGQIRPLYIYMYIYVPDWNAGTAVTLSLSRTACRHRHPSPLIMERECAGHFGPVFEPDILDQNAQMQKVSSHLGIILDCTLFEFWNNSDLYYGIPTDKSWRYCEKTQRCFAKIPTYSWEVNINSSHSMHLSRQILQHFQVKVMYHMYTYFYIHSHPAPKVRPNCDHKGKAQIHM